MRNSPIMQPKLLAQRPFYKHLRNTTMKLREAILSGHISGLFRSLKFEPRMKLGGITQQGNIESKIESPPRFYMRFGIRLLLDHRFDMFEVPVWLEYRLSSWTWCRLKAYWSPSMTSRNPRNRSQMHLVWLSGWSRKENAWASLTGWILLDSASCQKLPVSTWKLHRVSIETLILLI